MRRTKELKRSDLNCPERRVYRRFISLRMVVFVPIIIVMRCVCFIITALLLIGVSAN